MAECLVVEGRLSEEGCRRKAGGGGSVGGGEHVTMSCLAGRSECVVWGFLCSAPTRKQISETNYLASSVVARLRLVHMVLLPKKIPVVGMQEIGCPCRPFIHGSALCEFRRTSGMPAR